MPYPRSPDSGQYVGKRVRVLQIIQNLNYGGMERLLADIVTRADRQRFEMHVMALQYLGRYAEGLHDVATVHLADHMGRGSLIWPRALIRNIRQIAPDVTHSHTGVWYKAAFAARRAGVPLIIHTEHGRQRPDPWRARLQDGLAARQTDIVVAVSEVLAEQLSTTVVRDSANVRVVINGVDTELHRPRPDRGGVRAQLGVPTTAPVLGSIGRLEYIKGYDVMVDAFARLLTIWPDNQPAPVMVLCGEGSEREVLEKRAGALGLAGRIYFLGWRDDVQDMHATFGLFTMSSRSEGTSVSLLEAMSAGLCPVVTDVGGNAAVLGPDLRHRLVPPENPDALARAWHDALTDPARCHSEGQRARARVHQAFNLDAMVNAYEDLYDGAGR
ncbi:MAG: glycosyltransferase [Gemmatimonadaceae bacterium]